MLLRRKSSNKGKVVVGMSGGVDSSVAAAILKNSGREVIGITFKTWPKEECGLSFKRSCCNLEAITRARFVAEQLGIPYYVVDLHKEFKEHVIDYFCNEYLKGRTPNPCIACNEYIKFGALIDKAKQLDADHVATGHYASVVWNKKNSRWALEEGKDKGKDQSYFLASLNQDQLSHAVFPLGSYTKKQVRAYAKRVHLKTFDAEESQDICFIQDQNYAEYIKKSTGIKITPGDIVDKDSNILGKHKGIIFYTIGQRRGLGIAHKEPLYVTKIDHVNNVVTVGPKSEVLKTGLLARGMNWVGIDEPKSRIKADVKIRYNAKKVRALISPEGKGEWRIELLHPQEAPTPGQAVVLYEKNKVLGGGWIERPLD